MKFWIETDINGSLFQMLHYFEKTKSLFQVFQKFSEVLKFHYDLDKLKKKFSKNGYPQNFTAKYILKFFNNLFIWKPQISTVPRKELVIILPYLSKTSQIVKPYSGWASFGLPTDRGQKAPLPWNILHLYYNDETFYLTVLPYEKKIQKKYKSWSTPLEVCWQQHFFTRNQEILLYQEILI